MEDLRNGWVLGQFVRVSSGDIPLGVLGLEDSDGQSCLHRADLARLDLP